MPFMHTRSQLQVDYIVNVLGCAHVSTFSAVVNPDDASNSTGPKSSLPYPLQLSDRLYDMLLKGLCYHSKEEAADDFGSDDEVCCVASCCSQRLFSSWRKSPWHTCILCGRIWLRSCLLSDAPSTFLKILTILLLSGRTIYDCSFPEVAVVADLCFKLSLSTQRN